MPPVSSPGRYGGSAQDPALSRVRFRRAVTLVLMTLFLPGSAQLVAGRRDVGRIAIRVWLSVLGALLAVVLIGLVWHGFVFWFASNTVVLGFIRLLLCALAIGWALLFMDAWRLGQPLELRRSSITSHIRHTASRKARTCHPSLPPGGTAAPHRTPPSPVSGSGAPSRSC